MSLLVAVFSCLLVSTLSLPIGHPKALTWRNPCGNQADYHVTMENRDELVSKVIIPVTKNNIKSLMLMVQEFQETYLMERIDNEEYCPTVDYFNVTNTTTQQQLIQEVESFNVTNTTTQNPSHQQLIQEVESFTLIMSKIVKAIRTIKLLEENSYTAHFVGNYQQLLSDPDASFYGILCYLRAVLNAESVGRVTAEVKVFTLQPVSSEAIRHCRDYNVMRSLMNVLQEWATFVEGLSGN